MQLEDIDNISHLARIGLTDKEKEALLKDFASILGFVEQIQEVNVSTDASARLGVPYNVMRNDDEPHESGVYTKVLLAAAPATEKGYVRVKKIL